MSLPRDVTRCVGRFGSGPDDPICDRRTTCARYTAMLAGDGADDEGRWIGVPVATGLCGVDSYYIHAEVTDGR